MPNNPLPVERYIVKFLLLLYRLAVFRFCQFTYSTVSSEQTVSIRVWVILLLSCVAQIVFTTAFNDLLDLGVCHAF